MLTAGATVLLTVGVSMLEQLGAALLIAMVAPVLMSIGRHPKSWWTSAPTFTLMKPAIYGLAIVPFPHSSCGVQWLWHVLKLPWSTQSVQAFLPGRLTERNMNPSPLGERLVLRPTLEGYLTHGAFPVLTPSPMLLLLHMVIGRVQTLSPLSSPNTFPQLTMNAVLGRFFPRPPPSQGRTHVRLRLLMPEGPRLSVVYRTK